MKDKKKYVSCLLMTLLLACMIQVHTAKASGSPSLSASADTASVAKGGYVNVSIHLSGNPSLSTFGASLSYDSNILSYDSVSWNSSFTESDMKLASDVGSEVNLSVVCDSGYSEDGIVATVRFQAVSDSSSIPVILSLRDMADADLNAVSDCTVSSQVRVPKTEGSINQPSGNENGNSDVTSPETEPAAGAGSSVQQTSVQNTKSVQTTVSKSTKPDQNYKTGAGFGNDLFLLIAAACGIMALVLVVRKHGEEKK